jgi:putative transposase
MPRQARQAPGGLVYHALNRAVARLPLFQKGGDYAAFERVLAEALHRHPMRVLAFCLMPNHWHFVLWPEHDGDLTAFLRWLTHTHTMRWHAHYHSGGTGHLYQGRFKAFPVAGDEHLYTVLRYVERNPLRAKLVSRAEYWRWSSLWRRLHNQGALLLHAWPVPMPDNWLALVNEPQTAGEVEAVRRSVQRGCPYGAPAWQEVTARQLGLEASLRPPGRPKKAARSTGMLF